MSEYSEILAETGDFRVQLVLDEWPDEPYDDGASPLLRLNYRQGWYAKHIMVGSRPWPGTGRRPTGTRTWRSARRCARRTACPR